MISFKIGDRVTATSEYEGNTEIIGIPGMIVKNFHDDNHLSTVKFNKNINGHGRDNREWNIPSEKLKLLNEGEYKMARATYKLLVELPAVSKGAIYQENCDDGTQDFHLLDSKYIKFDDENESRNAEEYEVPREAVETQPQFFERVYSATETWLTRDQLEQFKTFLGQKPAGKPGRKLGLKKKSKTALTTQGSKYDWARNMAVGETHKILNGDRNNTRQATYTLSQKTSKKFSYKKIGSITTVTRVK